MAGDTDPRHVRRAGRFATSEKKPRVSGAFLCVNHEHG